MRFVLLSGLLVIGCVSLALAGTEAADKAALAGDYKTALGEWEVMARRGDIAAQYKVGMLYLKGIGTAKDLSKAIQWLELAAIAGHPKAASHVGGFYLVGTGVPMDYHRAHELLEMAASAGNAIAQFNMAVIYRLGLGVEADTAQAHAWATLAEDKGVKEARKTRQLLAAQMTPAELKVSARLSEILEHAPLPPPKQAPEKAIAESSPPPPPPPTTTTEKRPKITPDNPVFGVTLPKPSPFTFPDGPSPDESAPPYSNASIAVRPAERLPSIGDLNRSIFWAQLSTTRSRESAQSEWIRLRAKYGYLLDGRSPWLRETDIANLGKYVSILIGPFTSRNAITVLCTEIARNGDICQVKKRR